MSIIYAFEASLVHRIPGWDYIVKPYLIKKKQMKPPKHFSSKVLETLLTKIEVKRWKKQMKGRKKLISATNQ